MSISAESGLHFQVRLVGDVAVIEISGRELRQPEPALELGRALDEMLNREGYRRILLDFRHVEGLGSTGFAVILKLTMRVTSARGHVKVCGMRPIVRIGANIVGLDRLVEYFDDEQSALESF